jgi:hypothetical protein
MEFPVIANTGLKKNNGSDEKTSLVPVSKDKLFTRDFFKKQLFPLERRYFFQSEKQDERTRCAR